MGQRRRYTADTKGPVAIVMRTSDHYNQFFLRPHLSVIIGPIDHEDYKSARNLRTSPTSPSGLVRAHEATPKWPHFREFTATTGVQLNNPLSANSAEILVS